jgi:glycopeptide antibiotics resistance protein
MHPVFIESSQHCMLQEFATIYNLKLREFKHTIATLCFKNLHIVSLVTSICYTTITMVLHNNDNNVVKKHHKSQFVSSIFSIAFILIMHESNFKLHLFDRCSIHVGITLINHLSYRRKGVAHIRKRKKKQPKTSTCDSTIDVIQIKCPCQPN